MYASLLIFKSLTIFLLLSGSSTLEQASSANDAGEATQKIQAGDFEAATTLLHKGLAAHPSNADLWNLLGIAETELHHMGLAKEAFEHGLQIAPSSITLNENFGFLFYRSAQYKEAQTYLERAVSLGSDKAGVRFSLAASMMRNGQVPQALASLTSLEPVLADSPEYWEERGRAELPVDAVRAGKSFERALALAPNRAVALNGEALALEKRGRDQEALSLLIKARQANPDDLPTLTHFGMVCLRLDLGPDAIEALERARRLDPNDNSALYLLARANISVENWQKSHDLFDDFARRVPSFAPTYFAMGWLDIKLNRVDDARQQLEHCLSLAPRLVDARYELAQLDLNDGHTDTAEKLIHTVLLQDPNHAKANLLLGDLMMRRGNLEQAQSCFETAIRADPQLASAHYKLSLLYAREHQTEKAEHERALAATLSESAARQSKSQLKLVLPETEGSQ
jgi:tetratricopeptide (TPR) repeat protein